MRYFEDEVVLVTGSTDGIGRDIALKFADQNADVVVNGRSEAKAVDVIAEIESRGQCGHYELADIREFDEVQRMVQSAIDEMGRIDVLVCSGGATGTPPADFFRDQEFEDHVEYLDTFYLGRIRPVKAVLEHMIDNDGGRIVTIGADAGLVPTPGEVTPGAANSGLMMATKVLSKELARWNIQVNTVSISVTEDTPGLERTLEESPAANVFQKALDRQAFTVTNRDVAEAVTFLAVDRSITGQVLSVNGGISVR